MTKKIDPEMVRVFLGMKDRITELLAQMNEEQHGTTA
jgi:hypothetical protein